LNKIVSQEQKDPLYVFEGGPFGECTVPENRADCLEAHALLWIKIIALMEEATGCGLIGLLTRDDRWGDLHIDCSDLNHDDPECHTWCEELNSLLGCLWQFDCPPAEGCCCVRWFERLTVLQQQKHIENFGIDDDLWEQTWCNHDTEDWCDGEFYPDTDEGDCEALECCD
jgi:hypothetical protein